MRSASRVVVDGLSRLRAQIDGAEVTEQWIEPDPWSWVYRARPVAR